MAKVAALVCFALACVLLISSLAGASRAELADTVHICVSHSPLTAPIGRRLIHSPPNLQRPLHP